MLPFNRIIVPLLCTCALWFGGCSSKPAIEVPEDLQTFASEFQQTHSQSIENPDPYWALYSWKGIPEEVHLEIKRTHYFVQDLQIVDITFSPWEKTNDSHRFFPEPTRTNLDPEWVMHIQFDTENRQRLSLPVGRTSDGQWKIAQALNIGESS